MPRRYVVIWFRYLTTDWLAIRRPDLRGKPVVFAAPEHGRMVITAVNSQAKAQGAGQGMVVADAKAFITQLQVFDERPELAGKLLRALGLWCIRYTPVVAMDYPDGLILDITGCAHLWGGEEKYLKDLLTRLRSKGYEVRGAVADTVGAAWAVARFGQAAPVVESGDERSVLLPLPPAALRLEADTVRRLRKLGLDKVARFIEIPHPVLRRRFGEGLLLRLRQALGEEEELIRTLRPVPDYEERLPCLEPVTTAAGIEIAIERLLEALCRRLAGESKGLRKAVLTGYRVDGKTVQIMAGTSRATANARHIFKLFSLKIPQIEPALGIELFVLRAPAVEDADPRQEALWAGSPGLEDTALAELLDRLSVKAGACAVRRYLPDEHYWPERSFSLASSLREKPAAEWPVGKQRPVRVLPRPEPVEVSAPVPDYPPMLFCYKGRVHQVRKADGPERIEREWWMDGGAHRDYYQVEDMEGRRYWLFRSGYYEGNGARQWFIHGFFA